MYEVGAIRIWDIGGFSVETEKTSKVLFELKGRKLTLKYALIRTKFKGKDSEVFF